MKKTNLLLGSTIFAMAAAISQPAFAQDAAATEEACADDDRDGVCNEDEAAIIVTGTRHQPPQSRCVQPDHLRQRFGSDRYCDVNIGDNLNDLPSLRSTFSQGNSTRFIGTSGLNTLDLRGLGIERTLVLVNGRRHVTALTGDYIVDVNTIPTDLLQRVDIVTGGTSALYGSDAVAGTVNFILRRDFEGLRTRFQGGVSDEGDRSTRFASLTWGNNFADGRGNVALSLEYTNAEALYFTQRPGLTGAFAGRDQFNLREPTAGEPASGDGIFDNLFFNRVRNGTIGDGGYIGALCNAAAQTNAARCRNGALVSQSYFFLPNGNLVLNNPDLDFRDITAGGSTNTVGGLGSTLRNTGQLFPTLERINVNLLAHFELSDAFRPFIEAKYARIESFQEGQPSFFQGSIPGFFGGGSNLRCDNPFLNAQAYAQLQTIGRCDPAIAFGAANPQTFNISRFNVDFGGRRQDVLRETYRVVGGVEGTFNDDWRYEISANYGRFDERVDFLNNLLLFDADFNNAGFLNAIDATRDGLGNIVCRINADADTTNNDPACVPLNLFGYGAPSQAAINYSNTTGFSNSRAEQLDILAFVAGDSSQLFELPGGPIGFSIGGEYREESARQAFDPVTANGQTFLNAIQPFSPPKLTVAEAFGEIRVPVLRDLPFINELTFEGAVRYSDYNTRTGGVWAFNVGAIYSPFDGLRFRGNYSESVRAPTQGDLFSPQSENFAFIADPCDVLNITAGPNRAANCAADGVPVGFVNTPARSQSTGFLSGGNPTLIEENGVSYTIGGVFEPSFLPGFAITVDYYNIEVTNIISALAAQTIINLCYDSTTGINNPFCATVNRNPDSTFAEPAVISGGINFAAQESQGVDFEMSYVRRFDNGQSIRATLLGTYVIEVTNYTNPLDPTFGNRQLSELGDPVLSMNASINYDFGQFQLGYSVRYIGEQTINAYETQNTFQGRAPTNLDSLDRIYYPDIFYHNIRVQFDVTDDFNFYGGIDNVADTRPPLGLLGTAGGDPFDTVGRYFYFGVRARFR
ncbi:MAG: TonB-dependent receptor [Sphingomonadales bacterium]|nr:TonB-dependent receptor [Sphingomonadales bacterium]